MLHVHDLPLVYAGLRVTSGTGIPLVADLHENWPALMAINAHKNRGIHCWTNRKQRWEALESYCLARVAQVIVVADAAKARLVGAGIPEEKITVVSNTIDTNTFLAQPVDATTVERFNERFVVSYIGGFGPHRGIDTLLHAAKRLKEKIPNLCLLLAGSDGPTSDAYLNHCKRLARDLGVEKMTMFTGWAKDADFRTYTEASTVGIIPHKANEHTQTTMPNKLYHYMLLKKPVICTDLAPLKAVLDETRAGLCFRSDDAEDLADQIFTLYQDPDLRSQMGEAGQTWVHQKYNWTVTAQALLTLYDKFAQEQSVCREKASL